MMGMDEKVNDDGRLPIDVPDSKFADELNDFCFYGRFDVPGNRVKCDTFCEDLYARVRPMPVIREVL